MRKSVRLLELMTNLPLPLTLAWIPAADRVVLAATCCLICAATSAALAETPVATVPTAAVKPRVALAVPLRTWIEPPAPLVVSVNTIWLLLFTVTLMEALPPIWLLTCVVICLAMSFLVAAALLASVTLTAVPLTTRFKVLLFGVMTTGPVVWSVLVAKAAVALPAVMSILMAFPSEFWPLMEN